MAQPLQPSEAIQMWFDYRNSHSWYTTNGYLLLSVGRRNCPVIFVVVEKQCQNGEV
jgi:hypothetical protein